LAYVSVAVFKSYTAPKNNHASGNWKLDVVYNTAAATSLP